MNLSKYPIKYILLSTLAIDLILPKTKIQIAICYLLFLIVLDFITGILASYYDTKNKINACKIRSNNKNINSFLYFFNVGIIYKIRDFNFKLTQVVTSQKLKLTGIKFLLYSSTIIVTYIFEDIFFIKTFNLVFSNLEFSLTLAIVLFWSMIEWYSIFFENFKKIGIDIKGKLFELIKNILSIKNEIDKIK